MLEDQIELGCTPGLDYPICVSAESTARGMGTFIGWLAQTVLGSQEFAPGTTLWDNAIGEASNWFAIAIVVMLITGIVGVSTGMLSMKGRRLWVSVLSIAAAIPSTFLSLALGGELLAISDQLSELALKRIGGEDGFENLFRTVVQGGTGSDVGGAALTLTGLSSAVPMILMLIGILLGLLLMSFALAFRNLGLMVLIAFSPLAFMAVPMRGGWGIAKKWAMAGIALLLAKPLMFGILAMLLKTSDGMALFSPQTLTVMTGLFVVSFMPMMSYSFFAFLGSGNENMAGQGMAGQAGQKASAPVQRAAGAASSKIGAGAAGAAGAVFKTSKSTTSTSSQASSSPISSKGQQGDAAGKSDASAAAKNGAATGGGATPAGTPNGGGGARGGNAPSGGAPGGGAPGGAGGGRSGAPAPAGGGGGAPVNASGSSSTRSPQVPSAPAPSAPGGGSTPQPKPGTPATPKW
ncbi:hypothetical protein [Leucobacter chromiiresistens]|uniref:hypothetical protein n=1 Tax=Leucobacter chromiiresistens TaxID=1079994 RepID=UPI0012DD0E28|nr:hypothetical protein [Leucobacter chromiiresistens]